MLRKVLNTFTLIGFLVGILFAGIPALIIREPVIGSQSIGPSYTVGLIQLVALFFPALFLLVDFLFSYSDSKAQHPGKSGGVGPFSASEFKRSILGLTAVSCWMVSFGLVFLFLSVDAPRPILIASAFILIGISITPLIITTVLLAELSD
jgi:hypothetical protein